MYHITLCRSKKIIYPEGGFIAMNPETASHTLHRILCTDVLTYQVFQPVRALHRRSQETLLTIRIFDEIAKVFVALDTLFTHTPEYWDKVIYIIVNKHFPFFGIRSM